MENPRVERVRDIMREKGITGKRLAEAIGITAGAISQQLQGGNISLNVYEYILSTYPDVSPDWLMLGVGDKIRHTDTHSPLINNAVKPTQPLEEALIALTTHLSHQDHLVDKLIELSAESQARLMSVNKIVEKLSELGSTFAEHMRKKDDECADMKKEIRENRIEAQRANKMLTEVLEKAFGEKTISIKNKGKMENNF